MTDNKTYNKFLLNWHKKKSFFKVLNRLNQHLVLHDLAVADWIDHTVAHSSLLMIRLDMLFAWLDCRHFQVTFACSHILRRRHLDGLTTMTRHQRFCSWHFSCLPLRSFTWTFRHWLRVWYSHNNFLIRF